MQNCVVCADAVTIYGVTADVLRGPTASLLVSGIPLPIYGLTLHVFTARSWRSFRIHQNQVLVGNLTRNI